MTSTDFEYLEFDQQTFGQESQWDGYSKEYTEHLIENDAIDPSEAGFLQGYDDALDEAPHSDFA